MSIFYKRCRVHFVKYIEISIELRVFIIDNIHIFYRKDIDTIYSEFICFQTKSKCYVQQREAAYPR